MLRLDELLELGDLLINKRPELKTQRTIFKSVGLAIQDISIAEMVYQNAIHNQIGQPFELS
jgi:ornithine cyclodeaminase